MAQADLIALALRVFRAAPPGCWLVFDAAELNVVQANSMQEAVDVALKRDCCFVVQSLDAGDGENGRAG